MVVQAEPKAIMPMANIPHGPMCSGTNLGLRKYNVPHVSTIKIAVANTAKANAMLLAPWMDNNVAIIDVPIKEPAQAGPAGGINDCEISIPSPLYRDKYNPQTNSPLGKRSWWMRI